MSPAQPFSDAKKLILRKLKDPSSVAILRRVDETALKRARIHLLAVLIAQKIYAQGKGAGNL